jgi:hypothetical protein
MNMQYLKSISAPQARSVAYLVVKRQGHPAAAELDNVQEYARKQRAFKRGIKEDGFMSSKMTLQVQNGERTCDTLRSAPMRLTAQCAKIALPREFVQLAAGSSDVFMKN